MEPTTNDHNQMRKLLQENSALLEENNNLLRKMHRNAVIGMWLKILWYAILIGLPLVIYWYVLAPYLGSIEFQNPSEIRELFELYMGGKA